MAFVVEDGTIVANANSYAAVAEADSYWNTDRNDTTTWIATSTADKQKALIQATQYLDATYRWTGVIVLSTQTLGWPRNLAVDTEGRSIDSTAIPAKLKEACFELAFLALSADLLPSLERGGQISRKSVTVGPIEEETEFLSGAPAGRGYPLVDRILHGLFTAKIGGGSAKAVRA